jgi:thiamine pyrophosphokinase
MASSHDPPSRPAGPIRHVVVVADGDVPPRETLDAAWPGWADGVGAVVAADGGLVRAPIAGLRPTLLVGDLDSLDPADVVAAEAAGLPVHRAATDKDESDTELALLDAARMGAERITVLGAFGGRAVRWPMLLAHPALRAGELVLLDGVSRVTLIVAPGPDGSAVTRPLAGPVGATLSLIPLGGDVAGVTTLGLRYPLADEPLVVGPARGLSNVRDSAGAAVTVRAGRLLVVETALGAGGLSSRP